MSEFNDFDDFDLEPLEDIIEDLDADDEIEHYGTPRHIVVPNITNLPSKRLSLVIVFPQII